MVNQWLFHCFLLHVASLGMTYWGPLFMKKFKGVLSPDKYDMASLWCPLEPSQKKSNSSFWHASREQNAIAVSQMEEQFLSSKTPSVLPYQDVIMTLLLYFQSLFQETVVKGKNSCGRNHQYNLRPGKGGGFCIEAFPNKQRHAGNTPHILCQKY